MLLNKTACFVNLTLRKTDELGQFNSRLEPELGFTIVRLDMRSRFCA
jgi:hypothetical protein